MCKALIQATGPSQWGSKQQMSLPLFLSLLACSVCFCLIKINFKKEQDDSQGEVCLYLCISPSSVLFLKALPLSIIGYENTLSCFLHFCHLSLHFHTHEPRLFCPFCKNVQTVICECLDK